MVETYWGLLDGAEVRYNDDTWELTGDVDVRKEGAVLAVDGRSKGDVRHQAATLFFGVDEAPDSLNPGNIAEHFDRLERTTSRQYLLVKTEGRRYRYELERMEYD